MSSARISPLWLLSALVFFTPLFGQPLSEEGRPLLAHFSPKDYKSHYQVWCAIQASDGRMWFGSLNGAVIYDGHAWTKADVPTSFVRQIIEGPGGRMFVGGEDVLGYIEANGNGGWRYVSLLDKIPADARPVGLGRRVVPLDVSGRIGLTLRRSNPSTTVGSASVCARRAAEPGFTMVMSFRQSNRRKRSAGQGRRRPLMSAGARWHPVAKS